MAYTDNVIKSTTNTLEHLQSYSLKRTALETLAPNFSFHRVCMHDDIAMRTGKTLRWHRWTNLAANTTPVAEAAVPTALSTGPTTKIIDATISQYADYLLISDLLRDTASDAILEGYAKALGFRAGLSGDNIVRSVIDAETGAAGTLSGAYLSAKDFRAASYILQGRNVFAQKSGWYEALIHPYNAFDVVNDPSSAGLLDIHKYTDPDKAAVNQITDRAGELARISGVRLSKSTNVKLTAGTPNQWRSYVFGRESVGTVSLASQPFNQINDPMKEVFTVNSQVTKSTDLTNPMGLLGGFVSYKFTLVGKVLSGPTPYGGNYKYIYFDAPSSIVA